MQFQEANKILRDLVGNRVLRCCCVSAIEKIIGARIYFLMITNLIMMIKYHNDIIKTKTKKMKNMKMCMKIIAIVYLLVILLQSKYCNFHGNMTAGAVL